MNVRSEPTYPFYGFREYTFSDLIYPFVMIEDLDWSCLLLVQPTQTYFYHISINQTIKIGPVITMVGLNLDEFMFMELFIFQRNAQII